MRGPGKPFTKGKSANPGGRTSAQIQLRRRVGAIIADETNGGEEIIRFALTVMRGKELDCKDAQSRRWAASFLADRLWGKAPLTVELSTGSTAPIPDMRGKSLDELRQIAAGGGEDEPSTGVH